MRPRQRDTNPLRRERWERENAAPRLQQLNPHLRSLRLSLVESRADQPIAGTQRVQPIVVATASSRFEIPCGETGCQGGGHDLTPIAGPSLRERRPAFSGTSACTGTVGDRPCDRKLEYAFQATYSDSDSE